jgi:prolyl 4-hydroxylase
MDAASGVPRREFDGGTRVCDDPLIHTFDGLLSPAECRHIVELARPRMRRSQVSGALGGRYSDGRTNALTWVEHESDAVVLAVVTRIAGCVGLPLDHAESLQVIHYERGQEYRPHFDAYDLTTEKGQRYCARGGQRLVTTLAYLSDVPAGGETGFPRLALDVQPRLGKVLLFHNCHPGTTTRDPRSYHHGKPPLRGDKWAFNLWFHERPYWPTRPTPDDPAPAS